LLSYRTSFGYNMTQKDNEEKIDGFRASSYQRYQGEKLEKRFNTFSYWLLTKVMDSHDVGRGRQGIKLALQKIIAKTVIIGIDSDVLFPIEEQKIVAQHIKNAKYYEITSSLGHDGFLTENKRVSEIIDEIINHKPIKRYLKVS
jgi:homoserine O-acetyltransferase